MKTVAVILVVVLLITAGLFMQGVYRSAKRAAKESGQRALVAETCILLEDYKSKNGEYPERIAALPFTYPDGGSPQLLTDITYRSSGAAYTLRTVGYSSGQTIEISRAEKGAAPLLLAPQTGFSQGPR
jgi:hypothetical protein